MANMFLSHSSIDKPFVEKLAKDLKRMGVNVWFDKYEIKVGEPIPWKIEEGIRENEYFGVVLSPASVKAQWVKTEVGAALMRQMSLNKAIILPIYFQECDIPYLLKALKYADFRQDYHSGLTSLAEALGITPEKAISEGNWRKFVRVKNADWQKYRVLEFEQLVTVLVDRAVQYGWSVWVGGEKNKFSITLRARFEGIGSRSISIKLSSKAYVYLASFQNTWNPNRLKASDFIEFAGKTVNQCEEFVWRYLEEVTKVHGFPNEKPNFHVEKFVKIDEQVRMTKEFLKGLKWYKGDLI